MVDQLTSAPAKRRDRPLKAAPAPEAPPASAARPSRELAPLTRPGRGVGRFAVRLAFVAFVGGLILALLVAALAVDVGRVRHAGAAASAPIALPPLDQRSVVYAADGSVLAYLHADTDREPVTLDRIAPVLINAVIDTEDDTFWRHKGVELRSVGRALRANVSSGSVVQGGSTITQQLVKNTMLTPKRDVSRKVKEMVLALRLEKQIGKRAVLERYLNTVYFGEGAYGVESAAERYFGVSAAQVTAPQAAMLAGLIKDPLGYDPVTHADAAKARRATVLGLMAAHGHLSPADQPAAEQTPLPAHAVDHPQGRDYFTEAVKQELLDDPRLGKTPPERYHAIFEGGLRVRTTVVPSQQAAAQAAVTQGLPRTARALDAAVAAVDPQTGAVRALVGGSNFGDNQFNAALQGGRQPGSSFKTFVLVTALAQGWRADTPIDGSEPCPVPNPRGKPNPWLPSNFEGEAFGVIPLADATAHSVNCAFARVGQLVGLQAVAKTAKAMGITSKLAVVPSMVLGTNVVTPLEMASAYATLAADGVYHRPHLIDEVDGPDDKPLFKDDAKGQQVVPRHIAREAISILRGVVTGGTGTAAALPGRDVAGKTGTAENYQDAWFVGFTPQLAAAVWMGDPHGEVPMTGVAGAPSGNVVGGSFPARVWNLFMAAALSGLPAAAFPAFDPSLLPPPIAPPPTSTTTTTTSTTALAPGSSPGPGPGHGHGKSGH